MRGCLSLLIFVLITCALGEQIIFQDTSEFKLVLPNRQKRFFPFFGGSEESELEAEEEIAISSDPAVYYAKSQRRKIGRRKRKRNRGNVSGSFSGGKKETSLNYAFLKPQTVPQKDADCKPASPISAFTFMNFVLASASIAANVAANINDNNNNRNNNNNDNNDNDSNFNIQNNNNAGNNANAIMFIPAGGRRKRALVKNIKSSFGNLWAKRNISKEANQILIESFGILEDSKLFCKRSSKSLEKFTITKTFVEDMQTKLCHS